MPHLEQHPLNPPGHQIQCERPVPVKNGCRPLFTESCQHNLRQRCVNLFMDLSEANNLPDEFNGHKVTSKYQKSDQVVLALNDLSANLSLNVEGYINTSATHYPEPEQALRWHAGECWQTGLPEKRFIMIRDAEVLMFHFAMITNACISGRLFLCFIHRFEGNLVCSVYDDTQYQSNASYVFGKHQGWEADIRWNYGSGSFTQTAGFYEQINFNNIGTSIINQNAPSDHIWRLHKAVALLQQAGS